MRVPATLLVLFVACTQAGKPFGRDDEAALRQAVKKATGHDPGEHACFEWPRSFPRVVVVGTFAHDRGCMYEGLFVDRTWYGRGSDASQAVLATGGWADADIDVRQQLAKAWVTEVGQAFGGDFVERSTTAFEFADTPAFEPVRLQPTKARGVTVSGWVSQPSGMRWEQAYHFTEYRFSPDGSIETTSTRQFAVDGQRIQSAEQGASRAD